MSDYKDNELAYPLIILKGATADEIDAQFKAAKITIDPKVQNQ